MMKNKKVIINNEEYLAYKENDRWVIKKYIVDNLSIIIYQDKTEKYIVEVSIDDKFRLKIFDDIDAAYYFYQAMQNGKFAHEFINI